MSALITKLSGKVPASVLAELPLVFSRFRIDTPDRLAHFLGQCSHESGEFKTVKENLNYSAEGLLKIFPKYFNAANVNNYARKPQAIANRTYANRMGNGNEASGDGFRYSGRGYIQLTGKSNYAAFDAFVDDAIIENPDLVATKYPLLSAAWFWHTNKLNAIADKGVNADTILAITRRINGGTIGLDHRTKETNKFHSLLK
jgi:putative chitinase